MSADGDTQALARPAAPSSPPTPRDVFAEVDLLRDLDADLRSRIVSRCEVREVAAGTPLLLPGEINQFLYFLLDGELEVCFNKQASDPIVLRPGQVTGELSVIDGGVVTALVRAGTSSQLLVMHEDIFWQEMVASPESARQVMRMMARRLRSTADRLVRNAREKVALEAIEKELKLAREVQASMLPRRFPLFGDRQDFAVHAAMEPAKDIGGDFYDAMLIGPDTLLLAVGDVSGKGVAAALFMVRVMTALRAALLAGASIAGAAAAGSSLATVLGQVNDRLAADNDAGMFATLFAGVVDLSSGRIDYVNFGHLLPYFAEPAGRLQVVDIEAGGVFGVVEGMRGATGSRILRPGARLVLYTDGVTEAMDRDGVLYGDDRLARLLDELADAGPVAIVDAVKSGIETYAEGEPQADDITVLTFAYLGKDRST